jgi:hypothetical protein
MLVCSTRVSSQANRCAGSLLSGQLIIIEDVLVFCEIAGGNLKCEPVPDWSRLVTLLVVKLLDFQSSVVYLYGGNGDYGNYDEKATQCR